MRTVDECKFNKISPVALKNTMAPACLRSVNLNQYVGILEPPCTLKALDRVIKVVTVSNFVYKSK